MTHAIIGWKLDQGDREEVLRRVPPRYEDVVADHITFGDSAGPDLPDISTAEVVGVADDGEGVQALVVALDGITDRPTGGTYHITWSLADGREAVESNDVIGKYGWSPVDETLRVRLKPASWP